MGSLLRRSIERHRERVDRSAADGRRIIAARIASEHRQLARLQHRLIELHPARQVSQRQARLVVLRHRLQSAILRRIDQRDRIQRLQATLAMGFHRHLRRQSERLASLQRHLDAVDPHAVLRRGYSITSRADGSVVRSVMDVRPGEVIATRLTDGSVESEVRNQLSEVGDQTSEVGNIDANSSATTGMVPQRKSRRARSPNRQNVKSPNQMDLFGGGR